MNIYLMQAVNKLAPNSQFTIKNDDYSTIIWHKLEGDSPTQEEVDAVIEEIKAQEAQAELDKAAKKATAEAKLVALGLDLDDLRALGL